MHKPYNYHQNSNMIFINNILIFEKFSFICFFISIRSSQPRTSKTKWWLVTSLSWKPCDNCESPLTRKCKWANFMYCILLLLSLGLQVTFARMRRDSEHVSRIVGFNSSSLFQFLKHFLYTVMLKCLAMLRRNILQK